VSALREREREGGKRKRGKDGEKDRVIKIGNFFFFSLT